MLALHLVGLRRWLDSLSGHFLLLPQALWLLLMAHQFFPRCSTVYTYSYCIVTGGESGPRSAPCDPKTVPF